MNTSHGILFVIDDDPKSRKAVAALASSMKITCETFASAEGFLDRCDPSLTGCALVDFRLGGMDGLQLQERLQAMGSALSVILISAYADPSLAIRALKGGAVAFIEKPYQNDELADAMMKSYGDAADVNRNANLERQRHLTVATQSIIVSAVLLAGQGALNCVYLAHHDRQQTQTTPTPTATAKDAATRD